VLAVAGSGVAGRQHAGQPAARGIASGWLPQHTAASIIVHLIDYSELSSYGRAFRRLFNTLLVSASASCWRHSSASRSASRDCPVMAVARLRRSMSDLPQPAAADLLLVFRGAERHAAAAKPFLFGAIFPNNRGLFVPKPLPTGDLYRRGGTGEPRGAVLHGDRWWRGGRCTDDRGAWRCPRPAPSPCSPTHDRLERAGTHRLRLPGGMVLILSSSPVLGLAFHRRAYR
jgi:hypothetical protein